MQNFRGPLLPTERECVCERETVRERRGQRERERALTLQLSKAIHWDFGSSRDKLQQPRPHLIIIILHSLHSGEREGEGPDDKTAKSPPSLTFQNQTMREGEGRGKERGEGRAGEREGQGRGKEWGEGRSGEREGQGRGKEWGKGRAGEREGEGMLNVCQIPSLTDLPEPDDDIVVRGVAHHVCVLSPVLHIDGGQASQQVLERERSLYFGGCGYCTVGV